MKFIVPQTKQRSVYVKERKNFININKRRKRIILNHVFKFVVTWARAHNVILSFYLLPSSVSLSVFLSQPLFMIFASVCFGLLFGVIFLSNL